MKLWVKEKEKMAYKDNHSLHLYDVGIFILIWMTATVMVTSTLFIISIPITVANIILAGVVAGILFKIIKIDYKWKQIFSTILISTVIIFGIIIFSGLSYDRTWDGSAYHRTAIGLLAEGWNPLKQTSVDFVNKMGLSEHFTQGPLLWSEVYPKASWYISAAIYVVTGNIECGKAYTLIFAFVTICIFYQFFCDRGYKKIKSAVLSLIAGINPMVLAQCQSFYIDGMTGCILMLLILESYSLVENAISQKNHNKEQLCLITSLIVFGCNLKFSTFGFCAITCIVCYLYLCFIYWNDKKKVFLYTLYYAMCALFSVIYVGATPYLTNIIRYGDPFYGFTGMMNGADLELQFGIVGLGKSGRALVSLMGKMSHGCYTTLQDVLKIPFTFYKDELDYYSYVDLRVSGSGIFFSGILITCLVVIIYYMIKIDKSKIIKSFIVANIGLIFFELLAFEGTYQIRYVSHIYIICVYALALCFNPKMKSKNKSSYFTIGVVLCTITFLNAMPWIQLIYERTKSGFTYRKELCILQEQSEMTPIHLAYYHKDFSGLQFDLKDSKIENYVLIDREQEAERNWTLILDGWLMYY